MLAAVRDEEQVSAEVRPGHATIVRLRGEFDLMNADRLREVLLFAYTANPAVLVDVTEATFIDAAILSVLAVANARCHDQLRIRGATGGVARLFQVADMEHLLQQD